MQNSMKNLATSTMQEVSSMTIMPPEPMMEPTLGEGFVIDRHVEEFARGCSRRRGRRSATALNLRPSGMPPPMSKMISRRVMPMGTSIRPVLLTLAGQGEDLGALALFGADGREPVAAVADDGRDVGEGFDVVDERGLAPQAFLARIGRAGPRRAAFAFDGGDEGGFLAADEGAGAEADVDVES